MNVDPNTVGAIHMRNPDIQELLRLLTVAGFTEADNDDVKRDPKKVERMIEALRRDTKFGLYHGRWEGPEEVRAAFLARMIGYGPYEVSAGDVSVDTDGYINQLRWATPKKPPAYTRHEEVAVVLAASLGSLKATCEFYLKWLKAEFKKRYDIDLQIDHKLTDRLSELKMVKGAEFQPYTQRWVEINVKARMEPNRYEAVAGMSPTWEMLALAAQHPERIKKLAETCDLENPHFLKHNAFWVPGLEIMESGRRLCPHITCFNGKTYSVTLAHWNAYWGTSFPEYAGRN